MTTRVAPRVLVGAAALFFSTGGAAIKATTIGPWPVAAGRSAFAVAALLLLLPEARRFPSGRAWLVGAVYAATLVLFVQANKLTTSANAIFLQSTAPFFLLVLSPTVLREPVRALDVAVMAALLAGMAAFFVGREPAQATAPNPLLGDVLAAGSALTWALTLAGLRLLAKDPEDHGPAAQATVAGNVIVVLACLPFALPLEGGGAGDVALVAFLGVVQIGCAYACLVRGLRHVPALAGSLLLLLEPALNPVWAWLVHGEKPGAWATLGALVVLGATTAHAVLSARAAAREATAGAHGS